MPRKTRLAPATFVVPMKALGVPAVVPGEWRSEIKFDGYRALALINEGAVELWSRTRKPLDYPEVIAPLKTLRCRNATLDGEIVALDEDGRSSFQVLQGRDLGERPPIRYYVFDLLHLDGESLLHEPLETRQARLAKLVAGDGEIVTRSPAFDVDPQVLLDQCRAQGLEGIVMKARGSRYEVGQRSGRWLKVKQINEQEFVIGGFTPPKNSRAHFGAIAVGYYDRGRLLYAGKVGSGFSVDLLATLAAEFERRRTAECPFVNLPLSRRSRFGTGMTASAMKDVTWLKPDLVAQVRFAEWTHDGLLRQPVFLGLRKDKRAREVRREG